MKGIHLFVILMICCEGLILPASSESDEGSLLFGVQNLTIEVPPTQTGVLGSKEHMNGYLGWLQECSFRISHYSNKVLRVFGMTELDWDQDIPPSGETITKAPITAPTPEVKPTFGIPNSSELTTIRTIRGSTNGGKQSVNVFIPASYWELWYTADPELMGGQDLGSYKGAVSALFPSMCMIVTDVKNPDLVETIEPPGGLDKSLWQRSSDPRPWSQKFYRGYREYNFDISSKHVIEYVLEIRVRKSDFTSSQS